MFGAIADDDLSAQSDASSALYNELQAVKQGATHSDADSNSSMDFKTGQFPAVAVL